MPVNQMAGLLKESRIISQFGESGHDETLFQHLKIAEGREIHVVRLATQKKNKQAVRVQEVSAVKTNLMKQLQQIQADLAALKASTLTKTAERP